MTDPYGSKTKAHICVCVLLGVGDRRTARDAHDVGIGQRQLRLRCAVETACASGAAVAGYSIGIHWELKVLTACAQHRPVRPKGGENRAAKGTKHKELCELHVPVHAFLLQCAAA